MVKRCWGSSEKIERLAERCRIDSFLNKRVRFLSLGMRQQAALTAAYLTGARYLLLDEPMNALDPTNLEVNSEIVRTCVPTARACSCPRISWGLLTILPTTFCSSRTVSW